MFNGEKYTDYELFQILNLDNPTPTELETQIMHYIEKYASIGNETGNRLARFFIDVYDHFFPNNDGHPDGTAIEDADDDPPTDDDDPYTHYNDNNIEGFDNPPTPPTPPPTLNAVSNNTKTVEANTNTSGNLQYYDLVNEKDASIVDPQITKQVEYSKDVLNPILKQTIRRIISVDSQYRENKQTETTNFTFNLSEPLKDVLALRLYSVQIPYTWYTINSSYGGNFFYLKGNAPGIDNGNHDYQIQISSGNYSPVELITAINNSINIMKQTYTDISFGETSISYNSNNILTTLKVDINKFYDQTNYYVEFPNTTSTQIKEDRFKSLSSYLGFNYPTYDIFAIYSARNLLSIAETAIYDTDTSIYTINDTNNKIKLAVYQGNEQYASSTTTIIDYITITLSHNRYTRNGLVEELRTKLKTHEKLDTEYSNIERIDISSPDIQDSGKSYFKLSIKPNRNTASYHLSSIKYAVLLPDTDSVVPPIWQGNASCFHFDQSINEIGDIVAETETLQTNYPITKINQIQFICIADGYVSPINNYVATIPLYADPGYILLDYINNINTAIVQANEASSISPDKDDLNISTNKTEMYMFQNNVYLDVDINRIYTTKYYQISISTTEEYLPQLLNVDLSNHAQAFQHEFTIRSYVLYPTDTITIMPLTGNPSGNNGAGSFVVSMADNPEGELFNNIERLRFHIQNKINTYSDTEGSYPLQGTTLSFRFNADRQYGTFTLSVNVQKSLSQKDYKVVFYDENEAMFDTNNWDTYLHFGQGEYVLSSTTSPYITNANGLTTIVNDTPVFDDRIQLYDGSNNYFYVKAHNIDGLAGSVAEIVKITIPVAQDGADYTLDDLLDNINEQFSANSYLSGSKITTVIDGIKIYCKISICVNVRYTTKDFRLAFYDPYSFVSCYVGATRTRGRAIKNTTWDTTLGWILGFRENIVYYLQDYLDNNANDDLIYYNGNVCYLIGDTCLNVNLYNYFLIVLDDYTQSHLNDGLVTIIPQENRIEVPSIANVVCDPITGEKYVSGARTETIGRKLTTKQLYAYNERLNAKKTKAKSYSAGPFVKDVMGLIPIKPSTTNGSVYVEFGGTLQNQDRMYFGPVNIHRITVKLVNDRGDIVDLNNTNWSFSLVCEQLYNDKSTQ